MAFLLWQGYRNTYILRTSSFLSLWDIKIHEMDQCEHHWHLIQSAAPTENPSPTVDCNSTHVVTYQNNHICFSIRYHIAHQTTAVTHFQRIIDSSNWKLVCNHTKPGEYTHWQVGYCFILYELWTHFQFWLLVQILVYPDQLKFLPYKKVSKN